MSLLIHPHQISGGLRILVDAFCHDPTIYFRWKESLVAPGPASTGPFPSRHLMSFCNMSFEILTSLISLTSLHNNHFLSLLTLSSRGMKHILRFSDHHSR